MEGRESRTHGGQTRSESLVVVVEEVDSSDCKIWIDRLEKLRLDESNSVEGLYNFDMAKNRKSVYL